MIDKLETKPFKRKMQRTAAVVLASMAISFGLFYIYMLGEVWPLFIVGLFLFIARYLWITSSCSLEIGREGIIIQMHSSRTFLPWSDLGEFAPGNWIENNKVEFTLRGEKSLASIYQGMANLKLYTPRYLPDTFGMSARDLADLLNKRMKENAQVKDSGGRIQPQI